MSLYTANMKDSGEVTYLFSGDVYHTFINFLQVEEAKNIAENWGLPSDLDAAFQWSKTGLIYFIKGK